MMEYLQHLRNFQRSSLMNAEETKVLFKVSFEVTQRYLPFVRALTTVEGRGSRASET